MPAAFGGPGGRAHDLAYKLDRVRLALRPAGMEGGMQEAMDHLEQVAVSLR